VACSLYPGNGNTTILWHRSKGKTRRANVNTEGTWPRPRVPYRIHSLFSSASQCAAVGSPGRRAMATSWQKDNGQLCDIISGIKGHGTQENWPTNKRLGSRMSGWPASAIDKGKTGAQSLPESPSSTFKVGVRVRVPVRVAPGFAFFYTPLFLLCCLLPLPKP